MNNPIKDNRIVKDKTFALRLLSFALDTNSSSACDEDEKESMISYSTSLLQYQIETATDAEEIDYLGRCKATKRLSEGFDFLGKQFKCDVCPSQFYSMKELIAHIKVCDKDRFV